MQYYDRACRLGDGDGCAGVARILFNGDRGVPRDDGKAYPYAVEACKRNSTDSGCYIAAFIAFQGQGVPHDRDAGHDLMMHGCKIKDPAACGYGANIYALGRFGFQADGRMAFNFADRGCGIRRPAAAEACYIAGWLVSGELGISADIPSAAIYFERSCIMGEAAGCLNAATMLHRSQGIEAAGDKILSLYRQACDKGLAAGCTWTGFAHLEMGDVEAAKTRYREGCQGGDASGCYGMAVALAKQGRHLDGRDWTARACDMDNASACEYLAALDRHKSELQAHREAVAAYQAKVAAVTAALEEADFRRAIHLAVEQLRDRQQAARVIVAAENAGRIGDIDDIYIHTLRSWFATTHSTADAIVHRELKAIKQAEKASQRQFRITPTRNGPPALPGGLAERMAEHSERTYRENLNRYLAGGRPADPRVYRVLE
ncbi:beta-lactamase hcpE [Salinisphaera sp. PC39]